MQHEALFRRVSLWFGLNFVSSLVGFAVTSLVYSKAGQFFGWQSSNTTVFSIVLFLLAFAVLAFHTFIAYNADQKRFGGTHARYTALTTLLRNALHAGLYGLVLGVCLLRPSHFGSLSLTSLVSVFRNQLLVTGVAASTAILWTLQAPSKAWPLQDEPGSMFTTYGSLVVSAIRSALPRSTMIALSLASALVFLRTVEQLYFRWVCSVPAIGPDSVDGEAPVGVSTTCLALADGTASLPLYLPSGSVWGILVTQFLVVFAVTSLLHVLTESLSFVSTYPLDFQKLQAQLLEAEAKRARSERSGRRGNDTRENKVEEPNEYLLVRALTIGLEDAFKPNETSTSVPELYPQGSGGYAERTAVAAAEEQNRRHALLVASVVRTPATLPASLPYFGEVAPTARLRGPSAFKPTANTSNATASLRCADLLSRALAFQDLHRIATAEVSPRRALVYGRHWAQVIGACLGMIDATALQITLVDRFMTGEPLESVLTIDGVAPTNSSDTGSNALASTEPKKTTSFDNMLRLRAQLSSNNLPSASPASVNATNASVELSSRSSNGRAAESRDPVADLPGILYSAMAGNKLLKGLVDHVHLRTCNALQVPIPGRGVQHAASLPVHAVPPMCAATTVYALHAASILLVRALSEDTRGLAQRSMPATLRSLLLLEEALGKYCATLQASQFVRIASMGRTQEIRYRARSESAVPDEVKAMVGATRAAILRVVAAYRDELLLAVSNYNTAATMAMFSRAQLATLEGKLVEVGKADRGEGASE